MKKILALLVVVMLFAVPSAQALNVFIYSNAVQYRLLKSDPEFSFKLTEAVVTGPLGDQATMNIFNAYVFANKETLDVTYVVLDLFPNGTPLAKGQMQREVAWISAMENPAIQTDRMMELMKKAPLSEAENIMNLLFDNWPGSTQKDTLVHSTENNEYWVLASSPSYVMIVPKK